MGRLFDVSLEEGETLEAEVIRFEITLHSVNNPIGTIVLAMLFIHADYLNTEAIWHGKETATYLRSLGCGGGTNE